MSIAQLSDRDLLNAVARAAANERHATVELLRLLAELDTRRLYLGEGCSSLFSYCTQVLHLSEHAAYHRIEAARAARDFPVVLELVANGALTLTNLALLRPHLTADNHRELLADARHKTKRDVEHQIAGLAPKPDARSLVRKVPAPRAPAPAPVQLADPETDVVPAPQPAPTNAHPRPRTIVAPTAPDRYLVKVTVSAETHAKLRRAQDLLRHSIPNGDHAAILDRALTLLVDHLERQKIGRTRHARSRSKPPTESHRKDTRHIPAAIRREVWTRDQGRCAFEGPHGRCRETGRLEFHHRRPVAEGGLATVANLSLRCRAHNGYEWTRSGPS
jgi:5-methylcytosine-specific restriction endonuclease McrA